MALGGLLEIREICLHVSRNSQRFVTQVISTTAWQETGVCQDMVFLNFYFDLFVTPTLRYSYYFVRDCIAIISLFFAIPRDRP